MRPSTLGPNREIGARFRWVREHLPKGVTTQVDVAHDLGISVSHYSKMEVGIDQFSESLARNFCRVYGVAWDWLVSGEGDPWEKADSPIMQPAAARPVTARNHGSNEVCRALVYEAVRETAASMGNPEFMQTIGALSRQTNRSEIDLLGLLVWDKVKGKTGG